MALLPKIAFRIARTRFSRFWIGMVFSHFHSVLPINYIYQSKNLVAFYHPVPSHPVHILIVPTKSISGIEAITVDDSVWLFELFICVQKIVDESNLVEKGYRLIVNGGNYQEIPQLHFHLISEGR